MPDADPPAPSIRNHASAASRLRSVAWFAALLVAAPCLCVPAAAKPQATGLPCESAILSFRPIGDERLEYFADQAGRVIEVWCQRSVFTSRYDLRISGRDTPGAAGGHGTDAADRSLTVGGCFFDNGENHGPIMYDDSRGAYTKVEWINEDPVDRRTYQFSYDFRSTLLTVTATAPGCAPVAKVVAPQRRYRDLADLLPHPSTARCASGMPTASPLPEMAH